MICRRCGNRVPEYLTTRAYFECPACGRKFGTPPEEGAAYRGEPRAERYGSRGEASYNADRNRRAAARNDYADEDYYDDRYGVYVEPEQDYFEEWETYDERTDRKATPATMKLTTLIGFEALALIALAVVWLVSLGL